MSTNKRVFLSYCWKDFQLADEIDKDFFKIGIVLTRDIRDIEYKGSLREFIKSIKDSDHVIMLISDSFLKSINCMTEALELMNQHNFISKISPIASDDLKIYRSKDRISYTEYWQNERNELKEQLQRLAEENKSAHLGDLKLIAKIESDIGEFIETLADKKHLTARELKSQNYLPIIKSIYPESIKYYEGLISIKERNIKKNLYKEIIESTPAAQTLFILGNNERENRSFIKALEYYLAAILIDKDFIPAYINCGGTYESLGLYNDAIIIYSKCIEINNKIGDAYFNRGIVYKQTGDYPQAIQDFTTSIELNPLDHGAYNNRGSTFFTEGLYSEAINDFTKAIEILPTKASAYNNRGIIYKKLGRYNKAYADYNDAIKLDNKYAEAYFNRGLLKSAMDATMKERCNDFRLAYKHGYKEAKEIMDKYCN